MKDFSEIQMLMTGLTTLMAQERSRTQFTLGQLIEALAKLPADAPVTNIGNPHSYRGYYSDLAFEPGGEGTQPAGQLLALCRSAMGQVFEGYKGGDFAMSALTPIWVSWYGSCGDRIMGLAEDGTIITAPEEEN